MSDDDPQWVEDPRLIEKSEVFKAWKSLHKADRFGVQLAVSTLLALLLVAFAFGKGLEGSGQLGDTIGGAANIITLVVVTLSLRWARGEVARFREQQRDLAHAEAAREIWRRTYRFGSELIRSFEGLGAQPTLAPSLNPGWTAQLALLDQVGREFHEAWADFQLSFGTEGMEHLVELWALRVELEGGQLLDPPSLRRRAEQRMDAIQRLLTPRANLSVDDRTDEVRVLIAELPVPPRPPPPLPPTTPPTSPPPTTPPASGAQSHSFDPSEHEVVSTLFLKLRDIEFALTAVEERTKAMAPANEPSHRRLGIGPIVQLLARRGVLTVDQVVTLSQLREIRNAIAHSPRMRLTREELNRAVAATEAALRFLEEIQPTKHGPD